MSGFFRLCAVLLLLHAAPSRAMPMEFEFDVLWNSGPLAGSTSTALLTVEGFTGVGLESFGELFGEGDNNPDTDLLNLEIEIGGTHYGWWYVLVVGWLQVWTMDGELHHVTAYYYDDYVPNLSPLNLFFDAGTQANRASHGGGDNRSEGEIVANSFRPRAEIPAPGLPLLMAAGLAALGWQRRWQACR